ncbi:MAG: aspartate aminotransferase family protein [Deltaproteobacteria bacterium]|nr:aspartate aminotransferase family protein [Deltaproteobacteria bacterium]
MNSSGSSESIKALADKYLFPTYKRSVALVRGKGCRVWDDHGKEYLDFVGGIAVCALGHSSPIVTKVLEEQSRELVHVSNLYYTRPQAELAKLLVENSFADRVFFCNSGAEANEAAIKLARKYAKEKYGPGRHTIICMEGSFHGRTMATLSATGQVKVQAGYDPLLEGFRFVPFNDLEALKRIVDDSVCAVMLEPIQGEGGVVVPHPDYLKRLKDFCTAKGLMLILDEIQTGMGRTGRLFAHEHFGAAPDIMTLAKALGNGLPIGAMLGTEELGTVFGPGSHASTFGGTPLVTSVSKAVVTSLLKDGWLDHCRETGEYFRTRLAGLMNTHSCIKGVRGLGLIVGLELDRPGAPVVEACLQKGFLINAAQEKVLRFVPPLIVGRDEIDGLIQTLDEIMERA